MMRRRPIRSELGPDTPLVDEDAIEPGPAEGQEHRHQGDDARFRSSRVLAVLAENAEQDGDRPRFSRTVEAARAYRSQRAVREGWNFAPGPPPTLPAPAPGPIPPTIDTKHRGLGRWVRRVIRLLLRERPPAPRRRPPKVAGKVESKAS